MSAKRDRAWGRIGKDWRDCVLRRLGDGLVSNLGHEQIAESYRAAIRVLERAAKRKPATARARGK